MFSVDYFYKKLAGVVLVVVFFPFFALSLSLDSVERFFVEPSYDKEGRRMIDARLQAISGDVYFFVDNEWWKDIEEEKREEYQEVFYSLGKEFRDNIYPGVAEVFGKMPKHSVTGDNEKLSVVFHPMKNSAGGYFRSGDQYSMYRYSRSNERNAVYLNTSYITSDKIKGYLAHEYMHIVTFNKKNKEHNVTEEIWLNEARAELIVSLLGYNDRYQGSNLEERVRTFFRNPDTSLTEWTERLADYGVINVFAHYIVDHYGEEIFVDSLYSDLVGIESIEKALEKNETDKSFKDIFTDWVLAVYLNDCDYGDYYCFKDDNLRDLRITPSLSVVSSYSRKHTINYEAQNWEGSWHKVIGKEGNLYFNFSFGEHFIVPYYLCRREMGCVINYLNLDDGGEGSLTLRDFNSYYESVTFIPFLTEKKSGFNGKEDGVLFSIEMELISKEEERKRKEEEEQIRRRLDELAERIDTLYLAIKERYFYQGERRRIDGNLYFGMTNSREVVFLQEFLKKEEGVYPEGLVTGNFYNLTRQAVVRFQEKYSKEILKPLGIDRGTGFVGESTRRFINSRL